MWKELTVKKRGISDQYCLIGFVFMGLSTATLDKMDSLN